MDAWYLAYASDKWVIQHNDGAAKTVESPLIFEYGMGAH
jgi:hypothetical protein